MQTNRFMAVLGCIVLSATLISFSSPGGGDSFEIYLNKKLLVQQNLHGNKSIKTVTLQQSNYNDELTIKYSHCGRVGQGRTIAMKEGNKIIKQWRFADGTNSPSAMTIKVKDILNLKKSSTTLQLFYTADELPKGYLLASIATVNDSQAKLR